MSFSLLPVTPDISLPGWISFNLVREVHRCYLKHWCTFEYLRQYHVEILYVPGSISDGGVWANLDFAQALEVNEVDLPSPIPLPGGNGVPFPHFFVGDEAFPLRPYIMRPYPGRMNRNLPDEQTIFNYR